MATADNEGRGSVNWLNTATPPVTFSHIVLFTLFTSAHVTALSQPKVTVVIAEFVTVLLGLSSPTTYNNKHSRLDHDGLVKSSQDSRI